MLVRFTKAKTEDPLNYFEKKWLASKYKHDSPHALALMAQSNVNEDPFEMQSIDGIVKYNQKHLEYASSLASNFLPLIDGETIEAENLRFLKTSGDKHEVPPLGTVVLYRITSHSEAAFFFPCMSVVNGKLHRFPGVAEEEEEKLLSTLDAVLLTGDAPSPIGDSEKPLVAAIATAIASTIALGILSGASGEIGARATAWALDKLGLGNIGNETALTYDQFVSALKMNSREDYRQTISLQISNFTDGLTDYNNGSTIISLDVLYNEIRVLKSTIQNDEAQVDRVYFLAVAQAQYLAMMQEHAETFRNKDERQLRTEYIAMARRAGIEAQLLTVVRDKAIANRVEMIKGLSNYYVAVSGYNGIAFTDTAPNHEPYNEKEHEWYEERCVDMNPRTGVCRRHEPTTKGAGTIAEVRGRMDRHKERISGIARAALQPITDCIAKFVEISNIQTPPPPPIK